MSLDRIVDSIPIPVSVARTFVIEGDHTARDLSYGLVAGYLAGQRPEAQDGTPVIIGGNALRYALARTRRSRRVIENRRVFRMREAAIVADGLEEPATLPALGVMIQGSGNPLVMRSGIKIAGDAQQQWYVPAELAAAMRGSETVDLPFTLVQHARHRSSVPVMMRLLAWLAGTDPAYVKARENRWQADMFDGEHVVIEVPTADLLASLGATGTKPAVVMARMLEPAAAEITKLTGYRVAFAEVRTTYRATASRPAREGRLMAIRIEIDVPLMITRPARPVARVPGKPWKPQPKWHKPPKPVEPAPAIVADIAIDDDDDFDPYDFTDETPGQPEPPVPPSGEPRRSRFGGQRGNR